MKEVISEVEEQRRGEQIITLFPRPECLELEALHNLRNFCQIKRALELLQLKHTWDPALFQTEDFFSEVLKNAKTKRCTPKLSISSDEWC